MDMMLSPWQSGLHRVRGYGLRCLFSWIPIASSDACTQSALWKSGKCVSVVKASLSVHWMLPLLIGQPGLECRRF